MRDWSSLALLRQGCPVEDWCNFGTFAELSCNNGLPLFWFTLVREADLAGPWAADVRAFFADEATSGFGPLRLL